MTNYDLKAAECELVSYYIASISSNKPVTIRLTKTTAERLESISLAG